MSSVSSKRLHDRDERFDVRAPRSRRPFWLSAIGLGVCCIIAIRSVLTNGDIAYVFGYPTFGRGNFERHGLMTTVPLLLAFLAVCLPEALAGWLVWQGR